MADEPSDQPLPLARALTPAERERVVERLTEAFAHDLVPLEEFERRVDRAYAATGPAELRALVADLGAAPADAVRGEAVGPTQRIGAVVGNVERAGPAELAGRLEIRAFMANVELDLARSRLAARVTEIDVRCVMANVELRLPPGVDVEHHGGGFLGSFECHDVRGRLEPGAPVVRVVGRATFGSVTVTVAD